VRLGFAWNLPSRDRQTRQIIAFHSGDRSRDSANQLWANIPEMKCKSQDWI